MKKPSPKKPSPKKPAAKKPATKKPSPKKPAAKKPAAKKPAAKKAATKKPAAKKAPLDLNDPNIVPQLMEMAHEQEVARKARAAKEAKKPAKALRGEVAIRPSSEPPWGYTFELHPSLPARDREALTAFFTRFTTLGDGLTVLVTCRDTPAEDRRAAWDANRQSIEIEQLRAHLPSDDVAERTARLRRALAKPDGDRWYEIVMLLTTWDEATLPAALAVAEEGLARWPDIARHEIDVGALKSRPELQRLVRSAWGDMAAVLQRPCLDAATALTTQDASGLVEHQGALSHMRQLSLSGSSGLGPVAASLTEMSKLTVLELQQPTYSQGVKPIDLKKLLKAPHLRALDALSLYGYTLNATSLDALAKCEQPLTRLRIEYAKMKPEVGAKLAAFASRRRLTSLQLKYNDLGPTGAAALFARPDDWRGLRVLDISANEIGDEGTLALSRASLDALRWLSISSNATQEQLTARAAEALASAPSLGNLEGLFLMGHPVGSAGVAALLRSKTLRSLRRLNVSYSGSSFDEIIAACDGADGLALTELNLGGIDSSKPADWSRATFLRTVKSLSVDALSGSNYEGFFACPHLGSLEVLVLGGAYSENEKALEALIAAPRIPSLRYVDMSGWKPTAKTARAMARSKLFEGLWGVQFLTSYVPPEAWRAFYEAGVPLVNGGFDRFPANEITQLTTFRDEV
ncbi:MAG: hypothetical protein U0326_04995 [Polyangiales bacterium]